MGKSKSITDKEIVIVNNKPMWKSDFDKLQKEDSKSIFIGILILDCNLKQIKSYHY